jgi:hypothetical protein
LRRRPKWDTERRTRAEGRLSARVCCDNPEKQGENFYV